MTQAQDKKDKATLLQIDFGDVPNIEEALREGADVHAVTTRGNTALMWAAANGHGDVCDRLIAKGADVNAKNIRGDTALMWAARYGHSDICDKLVEKGANVNAVDKYYTTALIWAAMNGHSDACLKLIEKDAYVNAATKGGDTALTIATGKRLATVCDRLIENGAYVNAATKGGTTALMTAARYCDSGVGKHLLRAGAEYKEDKNVQTWLAEMRHAAKTAFRGHGRHIPTAETCFAADGKLSKAVLNACATNQFGTLIGAPLLASSETSDRKLFQTIWETLPPHWQEDNSSLYVQSVKDGELNPVVGTHTGATQRGNTSPADLVGR